MKSNNSTTTRLFENYYAFFDKDAGRITIWERIESTTDARLIYTSRPRTFEEVGQVSEIFFLTLRPLLFEINDHQIEQRVFDKKPTLTEDLYDWIEENIETFL